METPLKYKVPIFSRDTEALVSTISPSREYFFRIKTPKDLYWGLLCSPIAFFDINNNLIYHKRYKLAQVNLKDNEAQIVAWSKSGSMAYFIERITVDSCWHVLLDLKLKLVCRTECQKSDADFFSLIAEGDFDDSVIKDNKFLEFEKITSDSIHKRLIEYLGFSFWKPRK